MHKLFKEGVSKSAIAKKLGVTRVTIREWLAKDVYGDSRGGARDSRRRYSSEIDERIRTLKQARAEDNKHFVGSPHVQMDYAMQYPQESIPKLSHIDEVIRKAGLQTRKPKKRVKGGAAYLLYPVQLIRDLGYVQQSADFIGKKYIAGRTEPINIFSTSYYFPFKLYQIKQSRVCDRGT